MAGPSPTPALRSQEPPPPVSGDVGGARGAPRPEAQVVGGGRGRGMGGVLRAGAVGEGLTAGAVPCRGLRGLSGVPGRGGLCQAGGRGQSWGAASAQWGSAGVGVGHPSPPPWLCGVWGCPSPAPPGRAGWEQPCSSGARTPCLGEWGAQGGTLRHWEWGTWRAAGGEGCEGVWGAMEGFGAL